jgi:hypothetical protein
MDSLRKKFTNLNLSLDPFDPNDSTNNESITHTASSKSGYTPEGISIQQAETSSNSSIKKNSFKNKKNFSLSLDDTDNTSPLTLSKFSPLVTSNNDPSCTSSLSPTSSLPILSTETLSQLGVDVISDETTNEELLSQKGFQINQRLGSGSFGAAYELSYQNSSAQDPLLICKFEKQPKAITGNEKSWRHSNFGADRLDLPHLVKTASYFLSVELPDRRTERFFLPANKVRDFSQQLPAGAIVKIEGQIMARAPGENLAALLDKKEISLHPNDLHFQKIVIAVNEFLKAAYDRNFIHRDLKPENIMYDPASGRVTIIDTGESSRLRRRGKEESQLKGPSNPISSQKRLGSRFYMAPTIFQGDEYSSEVDYFSAGMLFLYMINKDDFKTFNKGRQAATLDDPLFYKNPKEFLSLYLEKVGKNSVTDQTLQQHPEIRKVIDLYFQASAGGGEGEKKLSAAAISQLNKLPYLNS